MTRGAWLPLLALLLLGCSQPEQQPQLAKAWPTSMPPPATAVASAQPVAADPLRAKMLTEIREEMKEAKAAGDNVRGYAFFHDQDAETAIDGSLYLSYGALDGSAQAAIAIGNEIVAALKAAGLQAEWSGDLGERIALVKLDWKKRRFTKSPAIP